MTLGVDFLSDGTPVPYAISSKIAIEYFNNLKYFHPIFTIYLSLLLSIFIFHMARFPLFFQADYIGYSIYLSNSGLYFGLANYGIEPSKRRSVLPL